MPPPRIVYNSRHIWVKIAGIIPPLAAGVFGIYLSTIRISIADDLIGAGRHWRVQAG